jgi:spermidine synthase
MPATSPESAVDVTTPADAVHISLGLMLCLSGAAGLIFEMVWFHLAGLVLGNSVWSTSVVLSSFMAGIALGNLATSGFGDRGPRLIVIYAVLEAAVAATGIAVAYVLPPLAPVVARITRNAGSAPWLLTAVRAAVAFAILCVPATAMGATLPVIVGEARRQTRAGFGRVLGWLYGWNTVGGVAGALAAELALIPRLGITRSAWCAGLLNLTAATLAVVFAKRHLRALAQVDSLAGRSGSPSNAAIRLLLAASFAGATLMALEVIWFRFLLLFVISSTLALSLMLAVVLTAIAVGAHGAGWWLKHDRDAGANVTVVALLAASGVTVSYFGFQFMSGVDWTADWFRILWFTIALTAPTSMLSGVLFTLLGERLRQAVNRDVRAAGWLTLANTAGAMCGPLLSAFVLLPVFGMERSLFAMMLAYCGIAALTAVQVPRWARSASRSLIVWGALAAIVVGTFPFGLMVGRYFPRAVEKYAGDGSRLIASREGRTETVLLMEQSWMDLPVYQRLITDGFSMSGTHLTGKRYMRLFVYWPLLLHAEPIKKVLVLCYGVGTTVQAATELDAAESIDVAEISRDVIGMSDTIYRGGGNPLHDARVRLHVEDGRQFLAVSDLKYDLITGEPPPPLTPGAVNIYSREFFQLTYDHLEEGGITTYWLPVAQSAIHDVAPIIRAFCDVFTDCSLWNGTLYDWMLVGSRHGHGPASEKIFTGAWAHPTIGPHLREVGFEVPEELGATFLGDAGYLTRLTADVPPLTDDYPRRILPTARRPLLADPRRADSFALFKQVLDTDRARAQFERSPFVQGLWPGALLARTSPYFDQQRTINRIMLNPADPLAQIEELDALLTQSSLRRLPLWLMGSNDVLQGIADARNERTGLVEYQLGIRALAIRSYAAAARYLEAAERLGLRSRLTLPLRVYALCRAEQIEAARQLARSVRAADQSDRHFWAWMGLQFGIGPDGNRRAPADQ